MSRIYDKEEIARSGKFIPFKQEGTVTFRFERCKETREIRFKELPHIVIQPRPKGTDEFIEAYATYILEKNSAIDGADRWVRDTFHPQLVEKMDSAEGRVSVCAQLLASFTAWSDASLKMHTRPDGTLTGIATNIIRRDIQMSQMFLRTLTKEDLQAASCFAVLESSVAKFQALLDAKDLQSKEQDSREKALRICREKVLQEGVFKEFPVSPILDENGAPWDVHLLPCQMFVESARVRLTQKPKRRELDEMIAAREEFLQLMDEDRRNRDPYRQLRMVLGDLKGLRDSLPKT